MTKKVRYTVYYDYFDPSANPEATNLIPGLVGYQIDRIVLDLVIEDINDIDASVRSDSNARYEQEFHLKFLAKDSAQAAGAPNYQVVHKSGNPGYVTGKPLLVGMNKDFSQPQRVEEGGFRIASTDASGDCLTNIDEQGLGANRFYDHAGTVLVYGETAYLSCNRSFRSVA